MATSMSQDIMDHSPVVHYGEAATSIARYRSNNNASSTSKCGGGSATSHRFQPNGHHRVVASACINSRATSAPNKLNPMPGCMPYWSQNLVRSPSTTPSGASEKVCQENAVFLEHHIDVRSGISRSEHQSENQSYRSLAKSNQPLLVWRNNLQQPDAQKNVNSQNLITDLFTSPTQLQSPANQSGYEISTCADRNIQRIELLRLYLHALCCSDSDMKCSVRSCTSMKLLVVHISRCCGCSKKYCASMKKISAHYQECKNSDCVICAPVKENLENKLHERLTSNVSANSVCNQAINPENHEPPLKRAKNETSLVSRNVEDHHGHTPTISNDKGSHGRPLSNYETSSVSLPVKDSLDLCTNADKEKYEEPRTTLINEPESMELDKGPNLNSSQENLENKLQERLTSNVSANSVRNRAINPENHEPPLKHAKNDTSLVSRNVEDHLGHTPTISNDKESHERLLSNYETSLVSLPVKDSLDLCTKADNEKCEEPGTTSINKPESMELDKGPNLNSSQESRNKMRMGDPLIGGGTSLEMKDAKQLHVTVEFDDIKVDRCSSATKDGIHVKDHISIVDMLTLQQTKDHLKSLKKSVDQTKEKTEENQVKGSKIDVNTCSLCGVQKLFYEPPIRCCAVCLRIISKGIYYFNSSGSDTSIFFCRTCFQTPGENITVCNKSFLKADLSIGENNPETSDLEEWWVECDKCKSWQHQTCALFNPVMYKADDIFYTCPNCVIQEVDSGEYDQAVQNKELKAKDLQTTKLSDHLENWIYRCLEEERQERADHMGKEVSEVPTAEGLVVRVVSSVTKRVEVKKVVQDIIKKETYPSELSYKSKAITLFQNIDGADVCLFIMYVQEYGSECAEPNKNLLCISYLDSVKHFTPDIKTISGEALRTFVYHQIIIGYLYYNKMLGFIGAYIWASPPRKRNDDYILNCHPKVQKVPKPDILRAWYHTMTRKAAKAEIVVEHTNLYDRFFAKNSESAATITAARLPYFDGDYWPGLAEELLKNEEAGKGNAAADRVLRAYRRESITGNEQDILFMHNLGEKLRSAKEDLMMVYLHHECKQCCNSILPGKVWICSTCKKFQLCDVCYQIQQNLPKKERHPIGRNEEHAFCCKIEVKKNSQDASEDEAIIQHDIFDTRLTFLEFCQQNHYQFDTLRRAKHSTMMILYHLHNPNLQVHELAHKDHNTQSSVADTQIQFNQIKHKLNLSDAFWSHALNCSASICTYKYCYQMRKLFYHAKHCKTRANGGCEYCQKTWSIISIHAQSCNRLHCCVPRCSDVKEWMKKCQPEVTHSEHHRANGKARMKSRIKRKRNG